MKVSAVVVTFHPDENRFKKVVQAILQQVNSLIIVDNRSSDEFRSQLTSIAKKEKKIRLILNDANVGIAKALNIGCDAAKSSDYILFLDHDSIADSQMVRTLTKESERLRATGNRIGAIGGQAIDERSGATLPFIIPSGIIWPYRNCSGNSEDSFEVSFLNTSGTLVSAESLVDVGPFDEGMFIDYVDTEWCLRARNKGYKTFALCKAKLSHMLGDGVTRIWFGGWRDFYLHSPLRCYYIFRNSVSLYKRGYISFLWKLNDFLRAIVRSFFIVMASSSRIKHMSKMMLGIWHGLIGRRGAFN